MNEFKTNVKENDNNELRVFFFGIVFVFSNLYYLQWLKRLNCFYTHNRIDTSKNNLSVK